MTTLPRFVAGIALVWVAACHAQVRVEGAWARPTVPGQQAGGGYVTLTSAVADRLVGGSTPAAGRLELHTMSMQGDVMQMRQVDAIDLPAGRKVELKPGGLHLMFIGVTKPLTAGSKLPVTLRFERAGEVKVEFDVAQRPADAAHKH
jgi:copper(I)-binding protein